MRSPRLGVIWWVVPGVFIAWWRAFWRSSDLVFQSVFNILHDCSNALSSRRMFAHAPRVLSSVLLSGFRYARTHMSEPVA